MRYLIDTDWIIEHLKGNEGITTFLEEKFEEGLAISAISSSPSFGVRLRSQVASVFSPRDIFFRPYKLEEMHEILGQRCRYGFTPGAMSPEALSRIVAEAYKRGGI